MHALSKSIERKLRSEYDSKGYVCPNCGRHYSSLEAMILLDPFEQVFKCEDCSHELVDDDQSVEVQDSQARLSLLHQQVSKIVNALKAVDEIVVPDNDFSTALANAIPVDENSMLTSMYPNLPPTSNDLKVADSSAPATTVQSKVLIDFEIPRESNAEKELKQKLAEQNALPVWHTKSTVGADYASTMAGKTSEVPMIDNDTIVKTEDTTLDDTIAQVVPVVDAIEAYFTALRKNQQEEMAEEAAAVADEMDDEDEDDFIDVPVDSTVQSNDEDSNGLKRKSLEPDDDTPEEEVRKSAKMEESSEEDSDQFEDV